MKYLKLHSDYVFAIAFFFTLIIQLFLFESKVGGYNILDFTFDYHHFIWDLKISIALLFAALTFIIKNKWWTVVLSTINAIWTIIETIYLQCFDGMFIDQFCLFFASNLNGFTSSVLLYLEYYYLWYFIPIIILIILIAKQGKKEKRMPCVFLVVLVMSFLFHCLGTKGLHSYYKMRYGFSKSVFSLISPITFDQMDPSEPQFVSYYSPLHAFIKLGVQIATNHDDEFIEITNEEIAPFYDFEATTIKPSRPLFLFLIESFETWTIQPEITPNIYQYIESHKTLFATKVKRQALKGGSADGQMIINTGLLPIKNGAACYRFPYNTYPSLSELYENSAAFIPGGASTWNQGKMNRAYHIEKPYYITSNDGEIVNTFINTISDKNGYSLIITISSHTPFLNAADSSALVFPESMPTTICNYLKCINYMDCCVGKAIKAIEADSTLSNSVIVFTGDHTIINQSTRNAYLEWCNENNWNSNHAEDEYCPLIVYSPDNDKNINISEEVFQMDIYPTIIHAIEAKVRWKGLGVNLYNEEERKNRIIDKDQALSLGDRLIRSNWFNKVHNDK